MRAIFTGITGLGKRRIAEMVALEAARAQGLPQDLNDHRTKEFIQVLCVEDEIESETGTLKEFLDHKRRSEPVLIWKKAMRRIVSRIPDARHTILCFHAMFYRSSDFFTCADWQLLRQFRPTVFVNLINDVYDTWETVNARERRFKSNSHFFLEELLGWRSAEIAATADMARNLFADPEDYFISPQEQTALRREKHGAVFHLLGKPIPWFLCSIKHPVKTLYQLLFRRDLPLAYASFPISKPRQEQGHEGMLEIDAYRKRLFETDFLTMFDPLAIDELRLQETLQSPWQSTFHERWPMTFGPPMTKEVLLTTNPFEGYGALQFRLFQEALWRHVRSRDYQLVSQSDAVAAYRPYYGGPLISGAQPSLTMSGGVDKEMDFALHTSKRPYMVDPPEDRVHRARGFSDTGSFITEPTVDALMNRLKSYQEELIGKRLGERENTWESQE